MSTVNLLTCRCVDFVGILFETKMVEKNEIYHIAFKPCKVAKEFMALVFINRPVGRAVTRSSLKREVCGSNFEPAKSDTVLPTARHRCDISSKGAVLPGRNDAEMGPANSLQEYNERFDMSFVRNSRTSDADIQTFNFISLPKIESKMH